MDENSPKITQVENSAQNVPNVANPAGPVKNKLTKTQIAGLVTVVVLLIATIIALVVVNLPKADDVPTDDTNNSADAGADDTDDTPAGTGEQVMSTALTSGT